ncbi:hypothetical protein INS49_010664 [Diaporthe citri]|uniref:uncharacterized protein n=1 Tax=Diaporthe citri TaxID=83186 RepID=UPI001C7F1BE1|nr:uncharacterized protein INS49_010664 [Diaporthe citri]KAG6362434.1 hypothetical protein INS49_010664 [Diaporthe citri]
MSDAPTYQTVMVTGANAFYSAAIIERLVDRGVKIHAVVRRESAGKPLEGNYGDKVRVFIAPDLTTPDAFRDAIRGCDAVFHVASPFRYEFTDAAAEVLDPAVNCAVAALQAAAGEPKVKRVVLTSSVAACLDPLHPSGFHRPGHTYTEADWNPVGYEQAAKLAAFPPKRHFDLVSINPCHTWGSYGQAVARAADMNATNSDLAKLIDGEEAEVPRTIMPWMCDISEVAQAHINALYRPEASGRYIIANHEYDFQQVVDLLHDKFRDSDWIKNVPKGTPGKKAIGDHFVLDNTRSREELGVEYSDWKQSVIDFCSQYQEDRKRFT